MKDRRLLGAHVSVAGGVSRAPERGIEGGCNVIQIFSRYPTRWSTPGLEAEEIGRFKDAVNKTGISVVAAHASYLINLATSDDILFKRSIEAMRDEIERAVLLEIPYVIVHPGSTGEGGDKERQGMERVAEATQEVMDGAVDVNLCLETTAGQGSSLGYRLSHFHEIISSVSNPEKIQVCLDSCHLHASGYDITSPEGFDSFVEELESHNLTERVKVIHMNDSKRERGSRVDRHDHIGRGTIGLDGFSNLLNFPPFTDVPFILETPKDNDGAVSDRKNLGRLKKLIGRRK